MTTENPNPTPGGPEKRRWTEDIELAGNQLMERVQQLIAEGNVRRLIIRHDGRTVLEVPLTFAAAAGTATVVLAPVLAALGAMAALLSRVQVSIEREGEPPKTGGQP